MRRVLMVLTLMLTFGTASAWIMPGDVDGDGQWTANDAQLIMDVVLGRIERADLPVPAAADPTRDGYVTAYDAAWVLARIPQNPEY